MPVLDAQELARTYGARVVLDGVTLTLEAGERLGLVGANGSGKSTLGRILAGVEEPDRGKLVLRRGARSGYLPQEPRFEGDPSARDAVLSGLRAWRAALQRHEEASEALGRGEGDLSRWLDAQARAAAEVERLGGWDRAHRAEALLSRLGVEPERHDQRVSTMSGGERRRVDLARVLVARPDVLVLDEPTNHLDVDTIEWLEGHLKDGQPGALVLITHDRYFLDRVAQRTAELSAGTLRVYEGGYEAYLVARAEREAQAERVERNRQNLLRRELEWLRRSAPARTSKQKARIQRAEAAMAVEAPKRRGDVALAVQSSRVGKTVLQLEGLRVELAGRTLVRDLTLSLTKGERMGVVGPNGSGKTSLLRTLLGELRPAEGRVALSQNARITYLGQAREGLDEGATVFDNVAGGQSRVTIGERTMDTRGYLERFLFDHAQQRQPVSSLSGGEKARVLLAKLLLLPTNLLILDEPTNDLDLPTLSALEQMLVEMDGTAIVVTHDRWFLDRVATGILAFEGGGEVVRYPGGYSTYRALRAERHADEQAAAKERARSEPDRPRARPSGPEPDDKRLTYAERLELEGLLERIAAAEDEVGRLEAELSDPSVYEAGGPRAAQLVGELDASKSALDRLMARWEELEERS